MNGDNFLINCSGKSTIYKTKCCCPRSLPDPIRTQTLLSSLHAGVADVIQTKKVQFGKMHTNSDGWEIIFAPPRNASDFQAIKHARQLNQ